MNWFRTLKTAMPLVERRELKDYMELGHCGYSPSQCRERPTEEQMWVIHQNWQLDVVPVDEFHHTDTFGNEAMLDCIAQGRFSKGPMAPEGKLSLVMNNGAEETQNPRKFEYRLKQVTKILEQHFGTIPIIRY